MACAIWYPHFAGKCLQFWCDNESLVTIINPGHAKALLIMDLLRFLTLTAMKHNFLVRACQVLGVSNDIADAVPISGGTFQGSHPHGRSGPLHHPAFLNDF